MLVLDQTRPDQMDPLAVMGIVDSNMVVEHDSRRKPFGIRDGLERFVGVTDGLA